MLFALFSLQILSLAVIFDFLIALDSRSGK
jgi:hypothetical protein